VSDILAVLDEVRAIARTGLHYCDDPFDRARYERLLELAAQEYDDRLLLVRRVDDGKWGLIAGWVEPNESPAQTVVRELSEEAGVRGRVDQLVGVFSRQACAGQHPHGTVSIVYLCSIVGGQLQPQLHEVHEVAWRLIDDVDADDWHVNHATLARASLEANWHRRSGL
jgi:8-oxo-dGTP pyrophosphatase MutT (NUDIX family)